MRNGKPSEVAHLHIAKCESVVCLLTLSAFSIGRENPQLGGFSRGFVLHLETKGRIHRIIRPLEHLVIADEEVGHEFGEGNGSIRVELVGVIRAQDNLAARAAVGRDEKLQAIELSSLTKTCLVEANAFGSEWIVDRDCLRL